MTHTATNVEWRQLPGEEATFEIRMPIILAPSQGSGDIDVSVGDKQVVIVKASGMVIWQCRMYSAIENEIEWTLEKNKSVLVMEVTKSQAETWPALLNVPLKADDQHLISRSELDSRIARELPSLPPVDAPADVIAAAIGETVEAAQEDGEKKEVAEETEHVAEEVKGDEADAAAEEETLAADDGEAEKTEESDVVIVESTPAAKTEEEVEEEATKEATKEVDPMDMLDDDDILNNAFDEVTGSTSTSAVRKDATAATDITADGEEKKSEEPVSAKKEETKKEDEVKETSDEEVEAMLNRAQVAAELRGIEMETEAITEKLEEMMKSLNEAAEGSEEKETLTQHVKIASRMLELVRETRNLRSETATIENFLKVQIADIQKARVNIGEIGPYETEEFQDDAEKQLTGIQLFRAALQYLNQDPGTAIHLLRLAAIHHHHAPSVVALFSIYTNVPSSYPRGASLMLQNALRGEGQDVEARTNSRVGDLFNSGTRHFPPIFSLAVHFHQRAAIAGNTHSMVSLAMLFLSGECSGDDTMTPALKKLNTDVKRANYFIQCAVDRGSIVSYLIRAAQYIDGADGMPKSMDMARKYYERAITAESSLSSAESKKMRIGTRMTLGDLEKRLNADKPAAAVVVSEAPAKAATTTSASTRKVVEDDDDIIELRPSTNRNAQPSSTGPRFGGMVPSASAGSTSGYSGPTSPTSAMGGTVAAPAKRNNAFTASANKRKASWERVARWGVGAYAVYVLAFPLRLIVLPFFYEKAAMIMDLFGLGGSGGGIEGGF